MDPLSALEPGTYVVVTSGTLIRLYASEAEQYTRGNSHGLLIQKLHTWREGAAHMKSDVYPDFLVMFSNDGCLYCVPADRIVPVEAWQESERLFNKYVLEQTMKFNNNITMSSKGH